jgi:hypothetical protein
VKKLHPSIAVFLFAICAILYIYNHRIWAKQKVLNYDILGYHNYLPAALLYKDITKYKYLDSIEQNYKANFGATPKYGLYLCAKDSNLCNQYPMGVAVFQAPFFLLAHWYTSSKYPQIADGYSKAYQYAIAMSTYLFALLGLLLLGKFLLLYFSKPTSFFTIILLAFGTNYFHYVTLEPGFSHIYLFFLYAAVLYLSAKWYMRATWVNTVGIGICIGLAIITRPVDIFICIIPMLWGNTSINKKNYLQQHFKFVIAIIAITFIICIPQLAYWKTVTGHWVYFSYGATDYFEWTRLRIWEGLFSCRKGWFVYTPIAFVAFIQLLHGKLPTTIAYYKKLFWVFFIPMLYIVFAWHNWFYGWSFGCRALIGTLPLLAIPLATFVQYIVDSKPIKKYVFATLLCCLVGYNAYETWQFEHGIIDGSRMNKTTYWKTFLRTTKPVDIEADYKLQDKLDWEDGY